MRIDKLLCHLELADDLDEAMRFVLAGLVVVNDHRVDKASEQVRSDANVRLKPRRRFASRGGEKLEAAFKSWPLEKLGKVALDLGASTGGFTDCLLSHGLKKVYAVDVGKAQLSQKLRCDKRVVNLEGTHAKELSSQLIPDKISLLVADVSFTSLRRALPPTFPLLEANATLLLLFKPQFEVHKRDVESGGIVADESLRLAALASFCRWLASQQIHVRNHLACPVQGRKGGNIEYLIWANYQGVSD